MRLGEVLPAWSVLESFARDLRDDPIRSNSGRLIIDALAKSDWDGVRRGFKALLRDAPSPSILPMSPASARDGVTAAGASIEQETIRALKDLFSKAVDCLIDERAGFPRQTVEQWKVLVDLTTMADGPSKVSDVAAKLKNLWMKLELPREGPEATIRHLHGLLMLLLESVGDLAPDDEWIQTEMGRIQAMLGVELSPVVLANAERALKDFGYRQISVRDDIAAANVAIRDMMAMFVERLGTTTVSTSEFSARLSRYSESIRSGKDLRDLAGVLENLVADTNVMQTDMSRTHGDLERTRVKVAEYETHMKELESKLSQANELVREDALTRVLNRRGLEQQYAVEEARSRRRGKPLSIAMLDLDDFKKLNDRLGHQAGDAALRRVVDVARHSIRPTDSIARYGGEEFVVLLPEADALAGATAMNRVLRDLAARPLLWNGEEAAITFSAGVVERRENESLDEVIARADTVMYAAKRAGKNKVLAVDG